MKKRMKILIVLLAVFLLPLAVPQTPAALSHPDPYSGDLASYEGTWIINGSTEANTTWTLEISSGRYHLHNEHQDFTGEVVFTPGHKDFDRPDTLWLDFDPELGIEIVLENYAGGLIEVSGQGFVFVRPGNNIEFDEAEDLEDYPKERMVGDWVLDALCVYMLNFNFTIELSNEDIMVHSITGDKRLIISFEDGILYQVSEKLEARFPAARYLNLGRGRMYFENSEPIVPYVNRYLATILPAGSQQSQEEELIIEVFPIPDGPVDLFIWFSFKRITGVDQVKGGE
ncbi:MAG: hypothetical protein QM296_11180 [Bacillota bacterium]|nr:hypothetical protein [Bacillota bacterium]